MSDESSPVTTPYPASTPAPPPTLVPQIWYCCPHCGGPLDLNTVASASALPAQPVLPAQVAPRVAPVWGRLVNMVDASFPISNAIADAFQQRRAHPSATPQEGQATESPPRWTLSGGLRWFRRLPWHWQGMLIMPLLALLLVGLALIWDRNAVPAGSTAPPVIAAATAPLPTPLLGSGVGSGNEEAAILTTIAQYNAAEPEVGATLTLTPVAAFLDPAGPLLARRQEIMTQRAQQGLTHATHLVQWSIGTVVVTDTVARVTTQEIWENTEKDAVTPQRATVHVAYDLRRDDYHTRWLIVDTAIVRI